MPSSLQNPLYHRSQFTSVFTDSSGTVSMDFFGSSYYQLFKNTIQNYSLYTVKQKENLDRLSWIYYDTTSLWWAIAMYNDVIHPMQIRTGMSLKIPARADLDSFVLAFRSATANSNKSTVVQI